LKDFGTDPGIRIRIQIRTKMSRIRNSAEKAKILENVVPTPPGRHVLNKMQT